MTDRPADFSAQRASKAERLAQLSYETLSLGAVDTLAALILHHRAWLASLEDSMAESLECGCSSCVESAPQIMSIHSQFARDLLRLEQALELLMDVGGYPAPDQEFLALEIQAFREEALAQDRAHDPTVRKLNSLLGRDCPGGGD